MEEKLKDLFYNTKPLIEKEKKFQDVPLKQEELAALRLKMDAWTGSAKN
jgi:hypothetical protein